jgi:hypothetical protein
MLQLSPEVLQMLYKGAQMAEKTRLRRKNRSNTLMEQVDEEHEKFQVLERTCQGLEKQKEILEVLLAIHKKETKTISGFLEGRRRRQCVPSAPQRRVDPGREMGNVYSRVGRRRRPL